MDKKKIILFLVVAPILLLAFLNILTVFTPEIGFDALWYHLTLPKLWLLKQKWYFEGGLLYYSVMPRLTETIFTPLVKYTGYIGPKLVQFASAVGVNILIWKITTKLKLSSLLKFTAISLFYCTWLVSWQSGSAYIDLFRTFLETAALYFFIFGSWKMGGIFLGLALGTKWLSLGSMAIYALAFGAPLLIPALFVSLPWFIVAYHFTGNPIYPIFSSVLQHSLTSVGTMVKNIVFLPFVITFPFDDFFSPLIGGLFILSAISLFSQNRLVKKIALVAVLGSIFSVVLDPPSSRFLLPYYPAIVIASVYLVSRLKLRLVKAFIILAILSSVMILGMRLVAVKKYLPFLLGKQTQNEFLTTQVSRLPLTFIDSGEYVATHIPKDSKILIDKLHNLYYFPYNFDHTSWVNSQKGYDYLITKDTKPEEVSGELLHTNTVGIQIYKL